MRRLSPSNLLLAALATLALLATAWLLWPWQGGSAPAAFFIPSTTPTITRATVQRLPTSTPFVPTPTPQPVIHVVQPKDVLGLIAKQYGVTEKAIMEANGLKGDLIIDGQKLVIPSPQRTPVVTITVVQTPTVTSTPTSVFPYDAPVLLEPSNGATFQGRAVRITLNWTAVAILAENEYYEVRLWPDSEDPTHAQRFYTQASSWSVPADSYPGQAGGVLCWSVSVVYRVNTTTQLSPAANVRRFTWH